MKTTLRIARLELGTLFYSPIAWFLLVIFMFQCGMAYTDAIEGYVTSQELGYHNSALTVRIFTMDMLPQIMDKLYLYLPLLTMGLMSREISSGTIKLLYSSPVKIRAIVLGKFMAMMFYNLLLTLVLGIIVVIAFFNIESVDYGLLLSALLGMYLLLCAYAAIGLFMSCLTSYQVVAAISTLIVFAILGYVGTIWQQYDFVRDLTYFLSISGRTENMLGGLITTKDILYFIVIMYLFLAFSMYKLQGARESKPAIVKASRYVLTLIATLAIGYVTSRPGLIGYLDATATQSRTIAVNTQKTIKAMGDEPLEVTSYINLFDRNFHAGRPEQRNRDMARWEPYQRFKPNIRFKYVYYYDTTAGVNDALFRSKPNERKTLEDLANNYTKSFKIDKERFLKPEQIKKIIDLKPERNRYVMHLKYKDRSTFLRLFDDMQVFPSETETSAALKRLMIKLPKIGFVEGQMERSIQKKGDKEYQRITSEITFRYALVNQGFDVQTVSLNTQDIPSDLTVLVIADPRVDFSDTVRRKLMKYIADGGNLMISGEPGKQYIMNPLLQSLGVQMKEGIIIQQSKDFSPDLALPYLTREAASFTRAVARAHNDSLKVSMRGAAGLHYTSDSGFVVKELLVTDDTACWVKKGKLVLDSAAVEFSAADGDEKGSVPTALSLSRQVNGKEQRIIVLGDADVMSNAELGRANVRTANFNFNTALFGWFTHGEFPVDSTRPRSEDNHVRLTGEGITRLKILLLGVFPGILLLSGTILLLRRRRK